MANSGAAVTYCEIEARCNRLAHLFSKRGLKSSTTMPIFMENKQPLMEACGAGERRDYTLLREFLPTRSEIAYIVQYSESRSLITSMAKLAVAARPRNPQGRASASSSDGAQTKSEAHHQSEEATRGLPRAAHPDQCIGHRPCLFLLSGTKGRRKASRTHSVQTADAATEDFRFLQKTCSTARAWI